MTPLRKNSVRILSAIVLALAMLVGGGVANAAYVRNRPVDIDSPFTNFGGGAGVRGTYSLDATMALDKGGNLWIWGYYGSGCKLTNTGQNGSWTGGQNGAQPSAKDGEKCQGNNNKPAVVRGLGCIKEVAGSAYATMAVDCYGNIYGWGDNTQGGGSTPVNAAVTKQPGYESEKKNSSGGVYGVYKDLTAPPEGIPDTVNQANPQESEATWKPIDGPGAPTGTYPGADNVAKVRDVASNEYGFAYLKEDGTVWTVGHNVFGARGAGKHNGATRGNWSEQNLMGWPVTDYDEAGKPGATEQGVTLAPTQVSFAPGTFIKALWSGYEGFYAVDSDDTMYYWGRAFAGSSGISDEELLSYTASDDDTDKKQKQAPCYRSSDKNIYCFKPVAAPLVSKVIRENGGYLKGTGGYTYGVVLTKNHKLWTWGASATRMGMPEATDTTNNSVYRYEPRQFDAMDVNGNRLIGEDVIDVNGGFKAGQFVKSDGSIWGWGGHKWGGAFSTNLAENIDAKPTNDEDYPGPIWLPENDPQKRKGTKVGGNKDGASFNLEDGSIYSWGENGGGAALGGAGYGETVCAHGVIPPSGDPDTAGSTCVSPKVTASGSRTNSGALFVWPASFVPGIQNVGRYTTITKNAFPFQDTAVRKGDKLTYSVIVKNDRSSFQNTHVRIEDQWGGTGRLVPGSFKAVYSYANGHDVDIDVTNQFSVSDTGFSTSSSDMTLEGLSVLTIAYELEVVGSPGQNVGGPVRLTDLDSGGKLLDEDETSNPIVD